MEETMAKYRWSDLSWSELEERRTDNPVILFPIGATEMHGHHLPLGNDFFNAQGFSERAAERTGSLVLPVLPYGYSDFLRSFAGTISVRHQTISMLVEDVARCVLAYGFDHLAFVNPHIDNVPIIEEAARRVKADTGIVSSLLNTTAIAKAVGADLFDVPANKVGGHGGIIGTAVMMVLKPELVDMSKARPGEMKQVWGMQAVSPSEVKFGKANVHLFLEAGDVSDEGTWGEPQHVTPEKAEQLGQRVVDYMVDFINHFRTIDTRSKPR
jgi:creatinine amidohydrolase